MWEKNKGTTKYDKSTVKCDINTAECDNGTTRCKKKIKEPLKVTIRNSYMWC